MGLVIHVFLTNIARRSLVFKLCRYVLIWSLNVTYLDLSPVHMHLFTGGGHFLYLCTQMYFGACEGEGGGHKIYIHVVIFTPSAKFVSNSLLPIEIVYKSLHIFYRIASCPI